MMKAKGDAAQTIPSKFSCIDAGKQITWSSAVSVECDAPCVTLGPKLCKYRSEAYDSVQGN